MTLGGRKQRPPAGDSSSACVPPSSWEEGRVCPAGLCPASPSSSTAVHGLDHPKPSCSQSCKEGVRVSSLTHAKAAAVALGAGDEPDCWHQGWAGCELKQALARSELTFPSPCWGQRARGCWPLPVQGAGPSGGASCRAEACPLRLTPEVGGCDLAL